MAILDPLTKYLRYTATLKELDTIEGTSGNRPLKILDAGSGSGDFTKLLISRGHHVISCDRDSGTVRADFEGPLPFRDRAFDVVISLAVVEHLENYTFFLSEVKRVGRNAIITTPSPLSKPVLNLLAFFHLVNKEHISDHKHYLSMDDISSMSYDHSYFLCGLNQIGVYRSVHNSCPNLHKRFFDITSDIS